jgi:hypothetical protein
MLGENVMMSAKRDTAKKVRGRGWFMIAPLAPRVIKKEKAPA